MSLQYKSEHTECRYYATEQEAVFHKWSLTAGNALPEFNRDRSIILYLSLIHI